MDKLTLGHYNTNAEAIAERYESVQSPIVDFVIQSTNLGGSVLDVGCGSGRDLAELAALDFNVYGVDASVRLLKLAANYHPELAECLCAASLPKLESIRGNVFDCVLCSAVLMHIPDSLLSESFASLVELVSDDGVLILSVCGERADLDTNRRDKGGRQFNVHSPELIIELAHSHGLELLEWSEAIDSLGRMDLKWHTLIFKKKDVDL